MDHRLKSNDFRRKIPADCRKQARIQQPEIDQSPVKVVVGYDEEGVGGSVDSPESGGRERLKRHRTEVAGQVWIPEIWGQEELLKDWIDCSAFDSSLVPAGLISARAALVKDCRKEGSSGGFPIDLRAT